MKFFLWLFIVVQIFFSLESTSDAASTLNVLAFGAVADYDFVTNRGTDNTSAFQKALDAAASKGLKVFVPAGNYLVGTLRFYPHASNRYPYNIFGRASLIGEGSSIILSKDPKTVTGTVLIHKDGENAPLLDLTGINSGIHSVVSVGIKDMSLLSGNKTSWLINMKMTSALNRLENLQLKVMPGNPTCGGISMVDSWNTVVSGIKIQGIANQKGTGSLGVGILINSTTETTNLTSFDQVDIYSMGIGIQIGRTVMGGGGVIGPILFQNSQVSHSDGIGIYVGNGTRNIKFEAFNAEFNYLEGLVIAQGAMNISYHGTFSNNHFSNDSGFNVLIGTNNSNISFAREIVLNGVTFFGCVNGIKIVPNITNGDCKNIYVDNIVFFPDPQKGSIGIAIDVSEINPQNLRQIETANIVIGNSIDFNRNKSKFKNNIIDNKKMIRKVVFNSGNESQ